MLDGLEKRIVSRERNGWLTAPTQPVKCADLRLALQTTRLGRDVPFHRMKRHDRHKVNERCNEQALIKSRRFGGCARRA